MKYPPHVPSALEARLRVLVAGARARAWASDVQRRACEAFSLRGLPNVKDEPWRFTPLRPTTDLSFAPSSSCPDWAGIELRADEELGPTRGIRVYLAANRVRVVGADGDRRVVAFNACSLGSFPSGMPATDDTCTEGCDGFALAADALAEDAAVVCVRAGERTPAEIEIVVASAAEPGPCFEVPEFWLDLEDDSSARLTELHLASSNSSAVLRTAFGRVRLGRGAALEHVRVSQGSVGGHSVALVHVEQSAGSRYGARLAAFGGTLSRTDLRVRFTGAGAECDLKGLYTADTGETVDHHTLIDHQSGGCTSRQRFKGIALGQGRAVFDGTVVVRRGAQKTIARQENRNLLLSEDAVVHTKPHLEIDADDVVCSHGATVGQLSAEEIFYFRSRGIDEAVARGMLTHAFGLEVLETVGDERLRGRLDGALLARLRLAGRLEGGA